MPRRGWEKCGEESQTAQGDNQDPGHGYTLDDEHKGDRYNNKWAVWGVPTSKRCLRPDKSNVEAKTREPQEQHQDHLRDHEKRRQPLQGRRQQISSV